MRNRRSKTHINGNRRAGGERERKRETHTVSQRGMEDRKQTGGRKEKK